MRLANKSDGKGNSTCWRTVFADVSCWVLCQWPERMPKLLVSTKTIVRFLTDLSVCLIDFTIVWLEEMSLYFAFDFRPGLITLLLWLSVHAYLFFLFSFLYFLKPTYTWAFYLASGTRLSSTVINEFIRFVIISQSVINRCKYSQIQSNWIKAESRVASDGWHWSAFHKMPRSPPPTCTLAHIQKYAHMHPFLPINTFPPPLLSVTQQKETDSFSSDPPSLFTLH